MNTSLTAQSMTQQRDAFVERMSQSILAAFDVFTIYLGDRLGLYQALAEGGALTSTELATRTDTCERYVREWLEQQAVSGILQVEDARAEATVRKYSLPPGHIEVLLERDSLNYLAPMTRLVVGAVHPLGAILNAYRNCSGVPYLDYGTDFREGQAASNRPMFLKQLGTEWLPAIRDVHNRLQADPPARVADIGCGMGWSCIGMAQAYPKVQVDGYDLDEPSIERARANAAEAGLAERVKFHIRDASDPELQGRYDLVTAFECIHDMSDPVGALRAMRALAGPHGAVLIVDERVGDTFTGAGDEVERMMYGWSVLHCLLVGTVERPSTETGTVMRTDTLRRYAAEAGFREVEVLPIDNPSWRFYRLHF